jgi:hypothetical protein
LKFFEPDKIFERTPTVKLMKSVKALPLQGQGVKRKAFSGGRKAFQENPDRSGSGQKMVLCRFISFLSLACNPYLSFFAELKQLFYHKNARCLK